MAVSKIVWQLFPCGKIKIQGDVGMKLSEREQHILQFFYDNQSDCCIDDGNVLYHYSTRYNDWKDDNDRRYDESVEGLITKGLIARDEAPLDCFIAITAEGIRHYACSHADTR